VVDAGARTQDVNLFAKNRCISPTPRQDNVREALEVRFDAPQAFLKARVTGRGS
jgi:hypothetical protein